MYRPLTRSGCIKARWWNGVGARRSRDHGDRRRSISPRAREAMRPSVVLHFCHVSLRGSWSMQKCALVSRAAHSRPLRLDPPHQPSGAPCRLRRSDRLMVALAPPARIRAGQIDRPPLPLERASGDVSARAGAITAAPMRPTRGAPTTFIRVRITASVHLPLVDSGLGFPVSRSYVRKCEFSYTPVFRRLFWSTEKARCKKTEEGTIL